MKLQVKVFTKYWDILKRNYQDKTHNKKDFNTYYSIFKEYEQKDFINAIKQVIKYQPYFPRVDEIVKYLPNNECTTPKWFNQDLKVEELTTEEKGEMKKIINELEVLTIEH